jgi:hypothetical protein
MHEQEGSVSFRSPEVLPVAPASFEAEMYARITRSTAAVLSGEADASGEVLVSGLELMDSLGSLLVSRAAGSPAPDPHPVSTNAAKTAGMPHARWFGEGT